MLSDHDSGRREGKQVGKKHPKLSKSLMMFQEDHQSS